MMIPGMLSVTFRKLSPEQIIELCTETGLKAIEWGGDIHVPHGDIPRAQQVRRMTEDAGLRVAAYGSYYRAGDVSADGPDIQGMLDSCEALGAPLLRVWPGQASEQTTEAQRGRVVEDLQRIADLAEQRGIVIGLEYHDGTLTDAVESAKRLVEQVDHPSVRLLWQPPNGMDPSRALSELKLVAPYVTNLHVFHWSVESGQIIRHPLAEGEPAWLSYLQEALAWGGDRYAMLEFVMDDSPEQFKQDASTLLAWLDTADVPR